MHRVVLTYVLEDISSKQLTERKLRYDIESLFVEIRRTPFEEYWDALHFLSNM